MPPRRRLLALGKCWVKSNRDLQVRSFRKPPNSSNNDSSLEMRLRKMSNPSGGFHAFVFQYVCRPIDFQSSYRAEEGELEQGKLKHTKLTVLTEIQPYFFNKCFPDCCKPLVNLQSSEKVDFHKFCQFSHCLYRRERFQMSLLCCFHRCHSPLGVCFDRWIFLLIIGYIFLPLCMPVNFLLHAMHYEFYFVGYWIVFISIRIF